MADPGILFLPVLKKKKKKRRRQSLKNRHKMKHTLLLLPHLLITSIPYSLGSFSFLPWFCNHCGFTVCNAVQTTGWHCLTCWVCSQDSQGMQPHSLNTEHYRHCMPEQECLELQRYGEQKPLLVRQRISKSILDAEFPTTWLVTVSSNPVLAHIMPVACLHPLGLTAHCDNFIILNGSKLSQASNLFITL